MKNVILAMILALTVTACQKTPKDVVKGYLDKSAVYAKAAPVAFAGCVDGAKKLVQDRPDAAFQVLMACKNYAGQVAESALRADGDCKDQGDVCVYSLGYIISLEAQGLDVSESTAKQIEESFKEYKEKHKD
jgi:hypothetical protein